MVHETLCGFSGPRCGIAYRVRFDW